MKPALNIQALWVLLITVLALLASCASGPETPRRQDVSRGIFAPDTENSINALLNRALVLPSPQSEIAYLEAARMLIDQGRTAEAVNILGSLDTADLETVLALEILVLRATLQLETNQVDTALNLLVSELPEPLARLPESWQKQIRLLRAEAYLSGNQFLPSARERIAVDALLDDDEKIRNHELIWNALTALPALQLQALAENELSFELQGWYELGLIGVAYQYNLDRQLVELDRWQQTWTRHPGSSRLPRALQIVSTLASERPQTIALLLPLKTPAGEVVRDGFMSAYFNVQKIGGSVPNITFYDTTQVSDIMSLYRQAERDGAEMIIGPLQKPLVAQLQQVSNLDIPILALNNVEGSRPRSKNLYQFALSPENEARQVALKAWQDGHRYAAILSPLDLPGEDYYARKRESFVDLWLEMGGYIVDQEFFRDDYTRVIENLLNLNQSEFRKEQLSELIGESLEFTQRRRQDIDFIFLIAQPGAARQINPSLAYLYAGDIPVYGTQDVFSGLPRPLEDADLNGILFSDSPWLLVSQDELKPEIQSLFPQTSALYLRLQAFGVDAFRLYPRLKQLETVADSQIYGATGLLKMDANRNINQELRWARFSNGRAQLLEEVP